MRLNSTSDCAFLDATWAWAKSPRPSAARVWCGEKGKGQQGHGLRQGLSGARPYLM